MSKDSRTTLFETTPVWSAILKLTIPMILSSIVSMIYNLSDTYFVGALNDSVQNAAITLVAPAMTLFYGITNLFGIGASSLMSRSLGKKDFDTVKKASATGLYFALVFAILLSLITLIFNRQTLNILGTDDSTTNATKNYLFWTVCLGSVPGIMSIMFSYLLRAEGHSMHASLGQMSGCILNIILDPIFILPFGFNLGAAGAGLATFISNVVACIYFLVFLFAKKKNTFVCLKPSFFTPSKLILSNILIVGIPGVFQNILNVVSMTILNNIVASYGTDVIAAVGIANRINQLPIQIVFGFTQGVMPLIGYNYANKNFPRMKEAIKKTYILTISALMCILVAFNVAGQPIVRIFMDNDVIAQTGAWFLSGFGFSLPFMCIDFMVVGITQAFGMGKYALAFSFARKVFLEIPLILLLNKFAQVNGIAYAQCITEITMSIAAIFVQIHLLNNKRLSKLSINN
ncbi:MAG: MATE family efflux transporter [Clostridia bacterium]|nr:MATE family efflux transporter [Clostridia bacterium]